MNISSGLSEGQVLQRVGNRGATALLSGTASGSVRGPVTATISSPKGALKGWKSRKVGLAARGAFKAKLAGIPAGGPYRLELRAGASVLKVKSFFVGDVWILAGQSNMEGVGNRSGAAKPHPLVRAFSMRREWRLAADPLHILAESPDSCHNGGLQIPPAQAEDARRKFGKGVGAGVFFGREMLGRSKVPQALVCTAHGGTSMEQWDPAKKGQGGASLYGSMLLSAKATGQPFAGVLWYQGESDANPAAAPLYTDRMKKLVAATRRDLRQPALPWVVVQIARVIGAHPLAEMAAWNSIQEQQRLLPEKIRNLETVSAIDLSLDDGIHISGASYPRLAARLARAADRLAYGNRREAPAPRLREIVVAPPNKGGVDPGLLVDIVFDNVVGGLRSGSEPAGFTFVGPDGVAIPLVYKTTLRGNAVRLHYNTNSMAPMDGTALSHGYGVMPYCNITDGRDMALPVFGPVGLGKAGAFFPFVTSWKVTPPLPAAAALDKIAAPDFTSLPGEVKSYPSNGFVNEHDRWIGKDGHAFFAARIELPEPMKLEFRMGYDGPFRLWLDGKSFFENLNGTNPCLPDESLQTVSLPAGAHDIRVAMDALNGKSWGFFLRFRRCDVTPAQVASGDYVQPAYSA